MLSKKKVKMIEELRKKGYYYHKIASELGISPSSVVYHLNERRRQKVKSYARKNLEKYRKRKSQSTYDRISMRYFMRRMTVGDYISLFRYMYLNGLLTEEQLNLLLFQEQPQKQERKQNKSFWK